MAIVGWIDTDDLNNPSSPYAEDAALFATWLLRKLTGDKYPGISETTEWYGYNRADCSSAICDEIIDFYELPLDMRNAGTRYLRMRHTPVLSVTSVEVGNDVLDPSEYAVSNYASLVMGSRKCWNLTKGVTVTYKHGVNPPEAGRAAALHLANELELGFSGSDECSLPQRVSSVQRQGISYDILDPQQFVEDGKTGIYIVDMFIHSANPGKAVKKPKIFSVDDPRGERYR